MMKAEDAENLYLKSQNPAFRSILSILVMGLLVAASSMDDHNINFNFAGFTPNMPDIVYEADAYASNNAIQLTLNQMKQNLRDGIGRATYYKPMHLWDKSSGNPLLADFATQFSFSIDSLNNNSGDGFAFFIAPNGSKIPPNSGGGHLGLQNNGIVNSSFVAVEFDTFGNPSDPFGLSAHVGIDLNSIETSLTAVKWWWNEIANGGLVNAFITYNSSTNNLSVLLLDADDFTRRNSSRLSATLDLSIYLPEWVTFGFSGTTGSYYELHTIYSWNFSSTLQVVMPTNTTINPPATSPPANPRRKSRTWLWVVLAIIGAISASLLVLGLVWFYCRRRNYSRKEDGTMSVKVNREMVTAPRKFSYKELRLATSNFADEGLLGEGGFGKVYLGFLGDINCNIAVKRVTPNSQQGFKEYESEITTITRLRHRNLVQLIGWCHDNNQFLIVYEFLPNKNLDYHLHREPCLLTWDKRYKIAMGLASALFYLQEECNQCVLHRDIKSSNVLLDLSFNAKLGDFGLARLVDHGQGSQTTQVMLGTEGYIAPECLDTYKAIKESDIYSFGIVAFEIATGKKAIAVIQRNGQRFKTKLVEWVWELYGKESLFDAADPRLSGNYDMEQMERLFLVGLACAHPNYFDRPSITQVVDILSFKAPLPILPPEMPIPTYIVSLEDTIATFSTSISSNTRSSNRSQNQNSGNGSGS
ncbi:L-type lectin-domain containing receptor kinase IX.1-like [Gossypium australe]|uniref:non-specific serine/threonine protein kinase n=1 Tax=Gossypium australe TaxID=47621 RepID=A0A5B6V344_9ROSI|nr:L-type lectin-domain containing receptor kinase IX.1-like [Gossypium australe]